MEHLNITFPENLRRELDREAKREHTRRSTLIQKAVKIYLAMRHRKAMRDFLGEGYREMSSEIRKISADFEALDQESWKDVN